MTIPLNRCTLVIFIQVNFLSCKRTSFSDLFLCEFVVCYKNVVQISIPLILYVKLNQVSKYVDSRGKGLLTINVVLSRT